MANRRIANGNQLGVTVFDTSSTAIIMGQVEIVEQILEFIPTVDFTTTKKLNESISLFESNIRFHGGLL